FGPSRLEVFFYHGSGDRSRGPRAGTAVLDDHRDSDLGIVGRGVAREDGMVPIAVPHVRALVVDLVGRQPDDLDRPGFTDHVHAWDALPVGRRAGLVHHAE